MGIMVVYPYVTLSLAWPARASELWHDGAHDTAMYLSAYGATASLLPVVAITALSVSHARAKGASKVAVYPLAIIAIMMCDMALIWLAAIFTVW